MDSTRTEVKSESGLESIWFSEKTPKKQEAFFSHHEKRYEPDFDRSSIKVEVVKEEQLKHSTEHFETGDAYRDQSPEHCSEVKTEIGTDFEIGDRSLKTLIDLPGHQVDKSEKISATSLKFRSEACSHVGEPFLSQAESLTSKTIDAGLLTKMKFEQDLDIADISVKEEPVKYFLGDNYRSLEVKNGEKVNYRFQKGFPRNRLKNHTQTKIGKSTNSATIQQVCPAKYIIDDVISSRRGESIRKDINAYINEFLEICKSEKRKLQNLPASTYNCNRCNLSFTDKIDFNVHNQVHLELRNNYETLRKKHRNNDTGINSEVDKARSKNTTNYYECDKCSEHLFGKESIKCHMNLHARRYACNVCGKALGSEHYLRKHKKLHTYTCDKCQITFASEYLLNKHSKVHRAIGNHTNIHARRYECEECSIVLASSYSFRKHRKAHEYAC